MSSLDEELIARYERRELRVAAIVGFYKREIVAAPSECKTVVDIGCGKASVDIALCASLPIETLHLIDGETDALGTKMNRFSETAPVPWRSAGAGAQRVSTFEFPVEIKTWPPDPGLTLPCDYIVSLLAWCHHFPAETYIDFAKRSLRPGGRIVVDCREKFRSYEAMCQHFTPIDRIGAGRKRIRWLFENSGPAPQ